ncbi:MAG: trypsin-like peptidase domain-containing protein [Pseudomonadota bacterium]
MKKVTLYSRSRRPLPEDADVTARQSSGIPGPDTIVETPPAAASRKSRLFSHVRNVISRHERLFIIASAALLSLALMFAYTASKPDAHRFTQEDIDDAVAHTLKNNVLPAPEAKAFALIQRSVVRVRQLKMVKDSADKDALRGTGTGTGVVILDKGVILTNLHVVAGADRVQVEFADGTVSEATVVSLQPENDLAVLQALTVPDDLVAATLRSTSDLQLGDRVIAVGFPFGIGPSVSSGVISGLKREYRSPEGERLLTNLIQYDAATNPGNSGGPLVTMDGAVVGIVTALLNPTAQHVFIGIGFAVPIENAASAVGMSPF